MDAAVHALQGEDGYFSTRATQLGLTSDSKDLTAMVAFTVFYNGWFNEGKSNYAYNGTNIVSDGMYTADHEYDPNAKDQNLGTYLVLQYLLENN